MWHALALTDVSSQVTLWCSQETQGLLTTAHKATLGRFVVLSFPVSWFVMESLFLILGTTKVVQYRLTMIEDKMFVFFKNGVKSLSFPIRLHSCNWSLRFYTLKRASCLVSKWTWTWVDWGIRGSFWMVTAVVCFPCRFPGLGIYHKWIRSTQHFTTMGVDNLK